jgi:hypothetical protein
MLMILSEVSTGRGRSFGQSGGLTLLARQLAGSDWSARQLDNDSCCSDRESDDGRWSGGKCCSATQPDDGSCFGNSCCSARQLDDGRWSVGRRCCSVKQPDFSGRLGKVLVDSRCSAGKLDIGAAGRCFSDGLSDVSFCPGRQSGGIGWSA